jgi:hypothetical protein
MFFESLSTDEPFLLKLTLDRGLTVVVGLGPKRRAWLAGAVADAMSGRSTALWGVAQVMNMRVDLGDPLVVRSTVGVDPVIGPEIWRSGGGGTGRGGDELWPSSSLPSAAAATAAVPAGPGGVDTRVAVAAGGQGPPSGQVAAPAGDPAPGKKRRWWRSGAEQPGPALPSAPAPASGLSLALPPAPVDERPDVPPPVDVADPPSPPILAESGPPVPEALRLPPRPVVSLPADQAGEPPAPPARPAALDAPAPGEPGRRPGPLVLPPAPAPPPPPEPLDPRFDVRVAEAAKEVAGAQAQVAACRSAAEAIVVPQAPDTGPVAAALIELERRLGEEAATVAEARRLAARWVEAQSGVERTTKPLAPAWLVESARRQLQDSARELAEAEAEAEAVPAGEDGPALNQELVSRLEAVHAEVLRLEAQGGPRRRLQTARDEEADLLGQLGVPDHASVTSRIERNRRTDRLAAAQVAVTEAEKVWADLQAPRDDAAAAAAGANLAAAWVEAAQFLSQKPADVLAALAARSRRAKPVTTAAGALASALRVAGVEPPGELEALPAAARTWLDAAGDRAAAVEAALAAARRAADDLRRAEEALAAAQEHHAEAVGAVTAAATAAAARRTAAELAHQQASARWRQKVEAAQAAHARAIEDWSADVAAYDRWAAARHEAEALYERLVARHHRALAAHEQGQREALTTARRQADEAWQAAVAALEEEFDRCHATRAEWERQRAEAERTWQAQLEASAAERRRLEEERAAALAALAAWEERHTPAPSLSELKVLLHRRVAENHTAGPAGAVPLVFDDALASLPLDVVPVLFEAISQAAASIQVIYLTDDPDIVTLARQLGTASIAPVSIPA